MVTAGERSSHPDGPLADIEAAIRVLLESAAALPPGETESYVRRCARDLRAAYETRSALEPVVDRLLASVLRLEDEATHGELRAFRRDVRDVDRLLTAIRSTLVPALRRVGFAV